MHRSEFKGARTKSICRPE